MKTDNNEVSVVFTSFPHSIIFPLSRPSLEKKKYSFSLLFQCSYNQCITLYLSLYSPQICLFALLLMKEMQEEKVSCSFGIKSPLYFALSYLFSYRWEGRNPTKVDKYNRRKDNCHNTVINLSYVVLGINLFRISAY